MTKQGIIYCLLSVLLAVYLLFAVAIANSNAAVAPCRGVDINVERNAMSSFVTAADINAELDSVAFKAPGTPILGIDIQNLEDRLNALSTVERANCWRTTSDRLVIDVVPVVPVARVFDPSGSYYINRSGKHLTASTQYQIDVPVVVRDRIDGRKAETVIPLLEEIAGNTVWNRLVTAVRIDRRGDIIIVPSISGHVVNFGTPDNAADKFRRLFAFYRQVLPVKGWNCYDTISVKFAGQVVGKIRPGSIKTAGNEFRNEDFEEILNEETILSDSVKPTEIKPKI